MAPKHDAKRAAKKHAKEKKRKAALAKRSHTATGGRPAELAAAGSRTRRQSEDPELDALLDEVDLARHDPKRREETFRRMLALDRLLAADGGVERFLALGALEDLARLWLSVRVGADAEDPIEPAVASMLRVLSGLSDDEEEDDLRLHLQLALEPLLFGLGRGDEALDRILLKPDLTEDDLDNATSAVLDSDLAAREHILRVRQVCAAWHPGEGEGQQRDACIEALDEALADRAER